MARGIAEILGEVRGGYALREAGELFEDLVKRVKDTGKAGSLTLKLKVEPDKADDRVVSVQPDVDVKMPKKPYSKGIFFMDEHGRLVRDDPKQAEMFKERESQGVATLGARTVPPPPTEPAADREADAPRADEANIQRLGLGRSA